MRLKTYSVTEINKYIKGLFRADIILNNLQVEGEISNFKIHTSGHMYFSLKDDQSRLRCVMFKNQTNVLKFLPEEGMKVIIKGYISTYERDGQYQLYVQNMQPSGIGALYKAFEQLKAKLEEEGLFKEEAKKPLPFLPRRIGVVTSPTGAAIRDIISVICRINPNVEIFIVPVLVQGSEAGKQISDAIHFINKEELADVIITGRGGGSIEELWAFNEEVVARSIANSKIPIISAVGHETDFTISDFVADLRAATPSAAAEMVIPSKGDLEHNLNSIVKRMTNAMDSIVQTKKEKINQIGKSQPFSRPLERINQYRQQLDWIHSTLVKEIQQGYQMHRQRYQGIIQHLQGIHPLSILHKGYGIIRSEDKGYISSVDQLSKGEIIQIIIKDGSIQAAIIDIEKGEIEVGW